MNSHWLSEKQFETLLLELIHSLAANTITSTEFAVQAQELITRIPKQMRYFEDKELGWAKYWIEENDLGPFQFEYMYHLSTHLTFLKS